MEPYLGNMEHMRNPIYHLSEIKVKHICSQSYRVAISYRVRHMFWLGIKTFFEIDLWLIMCLSLLSFKRDHLLQLSQETCVSDGFESLKNVKIKICSIEFGTKDVKCKVETLFFKLTAELQGWSLTSWRSLWN